MKKVVLLAILALGIFNSGCETCECDPDEYYIKYTVGVQSNAIWVPIDIEIVNEYGDMVSYSGTDSWYITLGAVEKDFTASLSVELNQDFLGDAILTANIQVSKNDGPFVVKASGESADENDPVQIDYSIDF